MISPEDRQNIVTASKIDYARRKNREDCVRNHKVID
jgi:hypothetical protein